MSKVTSEKVNGFRDVKVSDERYSIKEIAVDAAYNVVHVERKRFIYTAMGLFLNPGKAIQKVLDGYRQYLFHPGEYLFICGAIILFLTPRYKFFENEFSEQISEISFLPLDAAFLKSFFEYAEEYVTITNVIAIPIFTFLSYLLFLDSKKTVGENLVINTYITAQQLLILVFCTPFLEIFPSQRHTIITAYNEVVFLYNVGVYVLIFKGKWYWTMPRAILVVALGYAIQFPLNLTFYYIFNPILKYLPEF